MNRKIKLTVLLVVLIMVMGVFVQLGLAKKGDNGKTLEWSNGFPSGPHFNLNIHGMDENKFICNNSPDETFGNSIFVPLYNNSKINFVVNKKAQVTDLTVLDPCGENLTDCLGQNDPALIQLPDYHYQVYIRILGTPKDKNPPWKDGEPSVVIYPALRAACEPVTETVYHDVDSSGNVTADDSRLVNADKFGYTDGSTVITGDRDDGLPLVNFSIYEKYMDSNTNNSFDVGEAIYNDTDLSGNVTAGDIRLANAPTSFEIGSTVVGGDSDISDILTAFEDGVEMHEDTGPTEGQLDVGLINFGDLTSCEDQSLLGIGAIDGSNIFTLNETGLYRFDPVTTDKGRGKGKSTAVDITPMFKWTGWVCNSSIDINNDGVIDENDLPEGYDTVEEYLESLEGQDLCIHYENEWVFDIASLVIYGWDYQNMGAKLVQVRFYYPEDST